MKFIGDLEFWELALIKCFKRFNFSNINIKFIKLLLAPSLKIKKNSATLFVENLYWHHQNKP